MTAARGTAGVEAGQRGALLRLVRALKAVGYRFVTPTPATHARVLAQRAGATARDLRDVFGWNMRFAPATLDPALLAPLEAAGVIAEEDAMMKSRIRAASLGPDIFLHSAYPTDDCHAVFLGPDSYRFAALIARELACRPAQKRARLLDIGTGAGVGAIVAARRGAWSELVMTDINPAALGLAAANVEAAGLAGAARLTAALADDDRGFGLILANPPYILDRGGPSYRNGGGMHGGQVSIEMAHDAVPRLAPGGRLVLYTGSAIVAGEDRIHTALARLAADRGCTLRYAELDPDVFGEELEKPDYRGVERIAVVSAVIERAAAG